MKQFSSLLTRLAGLNKKLFSLLLLTTLSCAMAWAQADPIASCDFTAKTAGHQAYGDAWTYGDWSVYGAANNQNGWAYAKFGGKSATIANANPCYIFGQLASSVSKIVVTTNAGNLTKAGSVNSWGVKVYSDAEKTTEIGSVLGGTMTKGTAETLELVPEAAWPANSYYQVYFDLANTSGTNGIVWIDKIDFYGGEATSSKELEYIYALNDINTSLKQTDLFAPTTILASYSDGSTADVTDKCEYYINTQGDLSGNLTAFEAGVQIVNVSYTEGSNNKTTTYPLTITTDCTPLEMPKNLRTYNITSQNATLTWDEVPNATSYKIALIYTGQIGDPITFSSDKNSYLLAFSSLGSVDSKEVLWTVTAIGDGNNYCDSKESKESCMFTTEYISYFFTIQSATGGKVQIGNTFTSDQPAAFTDYTTPVLHKEDEMVWVKVIPDEGYTFKEWSGLADRTDVIGEDNGNGVWYFTTNPTDVTLTPVFEPIQTYTLTVNANPTEGGTTDITTASLAEGATTTVTATPNEGYTFSGWTLSGTGASISSNTATTTTLTMGTADATLTANFTAIPTYTLTYMANGQLVDAENLAEGKRATLPAIDDVISYGCDDKVFVGWSNKTIEETDTKPYLLPNYNMPAYDVTLYAVFATETTSGGGEEITDVLTSSLFTATSSTYKDFSDVTVTSPAVYAGNSGMATNNNNAIQLRSSNSNSGIVTTTSGGNVSKIVIQWHTETTTGRELQVYGKETPYTTASNLYDGTDQGTLLGSIIKGTSTELTISDSYPYIGLCSKKSALYIEQISITYGGSSTTYSAYTTSCIECTDPATPLSITAASTTLRLEQGEATTDITPTGGNGNTITYTISPATGARISNNKFIATQTGTYTITAQQMANAQTDGTVLCGQTSDPVEISVGEELFTVSFSDQGIITTKDVAGNQTVTQPATPEAPCEDYAFVGWTTTEQQTETANKPTLFDFTTPITADLTLYAVYGKADGDVIEKTLKVTGANTTGGYSKEAFTIDNTIFWRNEVGTFDLGKTIQIAKGSANGLGNTTSTPGNITKIIVDGNTNDTRLFVGTASEPGSSTSTGGTITKSTEVGTYTYNISDGYTYFSLFATSSSYAKIDYIEITYTSASLLYTTSPVCGPKISAKGNVRATSAQGIGVEAQDTIAVQAIRLTNADGKIANKLWISNISNPAFTARFVNETAYTNGQSNINTDEATATRNAQIVVTYTPTVANTTEEAVITITAENRSLADDKKVFATTDITVRGRSLPQQFAIVAEVNGAWYALPNNMSAADTYGGLPVEIAADAIATAPVQAVYHAFAASTATSYTSLPNHKTLLRFGLEEANGLWLGTSTGIKNGTKSTNTLWQLQPQDDTFSEYQLYAAEAKKPVGINTGNTAAAKRWGAYATACNYTVRLLPINATCYYAPAPELAATDIKATEATITTTMPAGYTQFEIAEWEYSLDQNNWTNIGASPFTATELQSGTDNTIYVRAYAAADNCAATGSVVVTTADCDDVPVSLAATATMDKVNISWQCTAPTATVRIYSDEQLTTSVAELTNATSPCEIGGLKANTTYYYKVLAGGTCASATAQFTTQSPHIEIVEWAPEAVTIEMNIDGAAQVEIEHQVEHGSEQGNIANDLFFSKYFEATANTKLIAIYNGTDHVIDLTGYKIKYGKTDWESVSNVDKYISFENLGQTPGQIQPNEEIILYSTGGAGDDTKVWNCINTTYPGEQPWVEVKAATTAGGGLLSFAGDKVIALFNASDELIDVIGAVDATTKLPVLNGLDQPSWGDAVGWTCLTGDNIQTPEIETDYGISTNRCLLIRKNSVKDGTNAVAQNTTTFATLCSEWSGSQVPDDDVDNGVQASCDNFAYVGIYDYNGYYKSFETLVTYDDLSGYKNADGTYSIPVPDLHTLACTPLRINIFDDAQQQLAQVEQKVPIMVQQPNATTDDDIFKGEKFGAEVCKTCDVVILPAADLSISTAATAINEVRSIDIYPGAELIVPANAEYTAKVVAFRSKDSKISSAKIDGTLTLNSTAANKVYHDKRITATQWYWFCLPYDCHISDITLRSGLPLVYNVDYQIQQYNGEARAEAAKEHPITATENFWEPLTADATLLAGKGYAIGLDDARMTAGHTYKDVRFPMTGINENQNKTTTVGAWGIDAIEQVRPNNAGWNLIGNPFVSYYRSADYNGLQNGNLIRNGLVDKDGTPIVKFEWDGNNTPYITQTTDNGRTYTQADITQTDLSPFLPHFVQVASGTALQFAADSRKQLLSPLHTPSAEADAPVRVQLVLTDQKQQSDLTGLVISNRYTNAYEVGADLYKWRGSGYKLTDKPVVATRSGNDELAFHALPDHDATAPVGINYFVRTEGDYTFTLNRTPDMDKVKSVYLYDALTMTHHDLLSADYRFHTTAGDNRTRFFVSIIVDRAPIQTGTEQTNGNATYASSSGRTISLWQLPAEATVWVYDAAGRLIANEHTHNLNRHYTVGAAGIYNIRIESAEGNTVLQTIVK